LFQGCFRGEKKTALVFFPGSAFQVRGGANGGGARVGETSLPKGRRAMGMSRLRVFQADRKQKNSPGVVSSTAWNQMGAVNGGGGGALI